jgi:hypothetical protein
VGRLVAQMGSGWSPARVGQVVRCWWGAALAGGCGASSSGNSWRDSEALDGSCAAWAHGKGREDDGGGACVGAGIAARAVAAAAAAAEPSATAAAVSAVLKQEVGPMRPAAPAAARFPFSSLCPFEHRLTAG